MGKSIQHFKKILERYIEKGGAPMISRKKIRKNVRDVLDEPTFRMRLEKLLGDRANQEIVTMEDVAYLFIVKPEQIRYLIRRGEIPFLKMGGSYRFSKTALFDWAVAASHDSDDLYYLWIPANIDGKYRSVIFTFIKYADSEELHCICDPKHIDFNGTNPDMLYPTKELCDVRCDELNKVQP